jgi:hypothetical protein
MKYKLVIEEEIEKKMECIDHNKIYRLILRVRGSKKLCLPMMEAQKFYPAYRRGNGNVSYMNDSLIGITILTLLSF